MPCTEYMQISELLIWLLIQPSLLFNVTNRTLITQTVTPEQTRIERLAQGHNRDNNPLVTLQFVSHSHLGSNLRYLHFQPRALTTSLPLFKTVEDLRELKCSQKNRNQGNKLVYTFNDTCCCNLRLVITEAGNRRGMLCNNKSKNRYWH